MVPPPGTAADEPRQRLGHSRSGIASCIFAAVPWLMVGVLWLLDNWAHVRPVENIRAHFLGTVLVLLVAGLTLGIVGLRQRTRWRLGAVLGVVVNSLTLLLVLAIVALCALLYAVGL